MTRPTPNYGLLAGAPTDADEATLRLMAGYARGLSQNPALQHPSDAWCIGRAFMAEGEIPYPISWRDIESDGAWAVRMLDTLGAQRGDFLFFSYLYSQSAQTWPWLKATFNRGAKIATGMPTQWDAYRLEMYLRLFPVKLVFGVTPGVLDGLQGAGHDIGAVFAKAGRVLALPGAWERLQQAGVAPWKLRWIGPMLALDPGDGGGARFDHETWTLTANADRILISNKTARSTPFDHADTGVRGEVRHINGEPRLFDGG